MKNKGFTLIELLGVMILIAFLVAMAFPSVINFIKSSTQNKDNLTEDIIINATELYVKDNSKDFLRINNNTYCITLNDLVEKNYLKNNVSLENENIIETKSVKITYINGFNYEIVNNNACVENIENLGNNLVPVIYNGTNWVVADITEEWYNYENQEWANAVILNNSVTKNIGDVVTVDGANPDALAMFVWIPRFEYKIEGTYGKGGTSTASPGEIEINFIPSTQIAATSGYKVHPAFTFGKKQLSGFWVGKFETSHLTLSETNTVNGLNCNYENCPIADELRVLPNLKSVGYNSVSNLFYAVRSMSRPNNVFGLDKLETDIHMMKNSEWAAVAYLSQSKYGKYGNSLYTGTNKEIYQNKSTSFITGMSNGIPSSSTTNTQCSYNDITDRGSGTGACGAGASTTGNITGVYDMSGGSWEYLMTAFSDSNGVFAAGNNTTYHTGFEGYLMYTKTMRDGVSFPLPKYYDLYNLTSSKTVSMSTACNDGICYGHGTNEVNNWYGDTIGFDSTDNSWIVRGGNYLSEAEGGIYRFSLTSGNEGGHYVVRVVLADINS